MQLANTPSPATLNAVASQAATEFGYLLPSQGVGVWRRLSTKDMEQAPDWEAAAVRHLMKHGFLTRCGPTLMRDGTTQRRMYAVEVP
jgi:hypothetical protein